MMPHTRLLLRRGFRATPTRCSPRIMSSDRVPGVKTVAGKPVTQEVSANAAQGASRLQAAVSRQKALRHAAMKEAAMAAADIAAPKSSDTRQHQLSGLMSNLATKIDGQLLAKDVVSRALRRRAMKLDDGERPLRMLFAGPSGVGKTVMATAVCEALLGSCIPDRNFKRFNLSEFSHPSKFNRLTGGDPNYVGYKEGGELTNFIRQAEERRAKKFTGVTHTSCVLLLDEVDKAAEGLLTFLMNFFDQGQLTSGAGEMVDARRAIVLMTTNSGRETVAAESGELDASASASEIAARRRDIVDGIKDDVLRDICDGRYENLGRLGTIVPFMPLTTSGRRAIVDRQLEHVAQRLREANAPASLRGWSDELMERVLQNWDDDLGGRSTRDFIEEHVVEAIADALDGADEAVLSGAAPPLELCLDVEAPPSETSSADGDSRRVVCSNQQGAIRHAAAHAAKKEQPGGEAELEVEEDEFTGGDWSMMGGGKAGSA